MSGTSDKAEKQDPFTKISFSEYRLNGLFGGLLGTKKPKQAKQTKGAPVPKA